MNSCLFTFRRKVTVNGVEKFNINFINPLNVTSMFWEENEEGKNILNVFLNAVRSTQNGGANAYSIRFGEDLGNKFVQHMEDFLRFMLAAPTQRINTTDNHQRRNEGRTARRPVEAEVVEEDLTAAAETNWVQQ